MGPHLLATASGCKSVSSDAVQSRHLAHFWSCCRVGWYVMACPRYAAYRRPPDRTSRWRLAGSARRIVAPTPTPVAFPTKTFDVLKRVRVTLGLLGTVPSSIDRSRLCN